MCRIRDKRRDFAAKVDGYLKTRSRRIQEAGRELLDVVLKTKLVDPRETGPPQLGRSPTNNYAFALGQVAVRYDVWQRPPAEWRPRSKNARKQFGSLARCLFARYDVPDFMDCAWFEGDGESERHRRLFLAIGRGARIQSCGGLPIPATGKMVHAFSRAPGEFTIDQAARYAQVIAMGGNLRVATAVATTRLGGHFVNGPFWESVIRFFIDHPDLDPSHYGPIIDFLQNEKFEPRGWTRVGGELLQMGPPKPHLAMKGRTVKTLLRDVERWHTDLAKGGGARQWASCGIRGMEQIEGDGRKKRVYTIREVTSAKDLRYEGRILKHCVASYARSCASGRYAIFCLRRTDILAVDRPWLTVCVDLGRWMIVEARGFKNALATQEQLRIVRKWAGLRDIATANYI